VADRAGLTVQWNTGPEADAAVAAEVRAMLAEPIAQGIVDGAEEREIEFSTPKDFKAIPGNAGTCPRYHAFQGRLRAFRSRPCVLAPMSREPFRIRGAAMAPDRGFSMKLRARESVL